MKPRSRSAGRAAAESRIRVLLAAVNKMTQAGYRVLEDIDPGITIETVVESADAAAQAAARLKPDIVLVDLTEERLPGIDLIKSLLAVNAEINILAVAANDDVVQAEQVLLSGARGFASKTAAVEEVVKAVRSVAAGNNYLEAGLAQRIALQKLMGKSSNLRVLSPREYEIFCLLTAGTPIKDIAARLDLTYKTVANYSGTIKTKLKARTREELRAIAVRSGVISK